MQSIRIVKRANKKTGDEVKARSDEKTSQQRTREMVSTVKTWVADWEQRNRSAERAFATLLR